MEISPLGDSALIIRVREDFERKPEAALRAVLETQRRLEAAQIPGVIECAPAYESVGVFFDPISLNDAGAPPEKLFEWLKGRIESVLKRRGKVSRPSKTERVLEIPVCYGDEFGPDLEEVAQRAKLSLGEVVRRHSKAIYRVHCIGFVPGFAYLGGLPRELATPRRATPRTRVPAGAVGIGGRQTGVYPTISPGGWNLIGRTPLRLFDPEREPPSPFIAGTSVKFRAITRDDFNRLSAEEAK